MEDTSATKEVVESEMDDMNVVESGTMMAGGKRRRSSKSKKRSSKSKKRSSKSKKRMSKSKKRMSKSKKRSSKPKRRMAKRRMSINALTRFMR